MPSPSATILPFPLRILFRAAVSTRRFSPAYAELQATSNYSFLRGASHPEELLLAAKMLGLHALAITDRNSLAGLLRSHGRAKEPKIDIRLVIGCRLDLREGTSYLVYPTGRAAYARLCQMLTKGKGRRRERQMLPRLGAMWWSMGKAC